MCESPVGGLSSLGVQTGGHPPTSDLLRFTSFTSAQWLRAVTLLHQLPVEPALRLAPNREGGARWPGPRVEVASLQGVESGLACGRLRPDGRGHVKKAPLFVVTYPRAPSTFSDGLWGGFRGSKYLLRRYDWSPRDTAYRMYMVTVPGRMFGFWSLSAGL